MRLFVFGGGFSGLAFAREVIARGGSACASSRDEARRSTLREAGLQAIDPADQRAVHAAAAHADAVLVCAPPSPAGCPGLAALRSAPSSPARWIGYLSTTGVYGDRAGGWVTESSALRARSTEAIRRVRAEADWRAFGDAHAHTAVVVLRLPGLYGPGRSPLDRVRRGDATRTIKPGQVFSRLHVDDLSAALLACVAKPRRGAIYNLCDDLPAAPADVTTLACEILGAAPPPVVKLEDATLSPMARRFWSESKRVSNALAKAELGWRPRFPTYREGLRAIFAAETAIDDGGLSARRPPPQARAAAPDLVGAPSGGRRREPG